MWKTAKNLRTPHMQRTHIGSADIVRRKVVVRDNLSFSSPVGSYGPKAQEPDKKIATQKVKKKNMENNERVSVKIADYDNGGLTIDIFGVVQYLSCNNNVRNVA